MSFKIVTKEATIEVKFIPGQKVWVMENNRPTELTVLQVIMKLEGETKRRLFKTDAITDCNLSYYLTPYFFETHPRHRLFDADKIFETKEDLLKSML